MYHPLLLHGGNDYIALNLPTFVSFEFTPFLIGAER
jgi:hypothetical protein